MGSSSSKRSSRRSSRRYSQSASSSSSSYGHNLHQNIPHYTPQAPVSSYSSGFQTPSLPQKNQGKKYSQIGDYYRSIDEVTAALSHAGLESSNLIVGIDVTKSNEWTGARSFNRQSLHYIGTTPNPYQQAISIIGKTLSAFDEDNLIPCYGFGDATTHDQHVFSFYPDDTFCNGFEEVLSRYREIVPQLRLAGPTSFAPIIERAMTIVEECGGQYHVLLIIADGQVTRSVDTNQGGLSSQEQKTIDAIVRASAYPLSIVLVGVGDGPWDTMRLFDDNIPARAFDNFQFVNFTEIMAKKLDPRRKEAEFALSALMEIPSQYKATLELGLLGRRTGKSPNKMALPPPISAINPFLNNRKRPGQALLPLHRLFQLLVTRARIARSVWLIQRTWHSTVAIRLAMNVEKTLISVPFAAALLQFVSSSIKNDSLSTDHRPRGELKPFFLRGSPLFLSAGK